jgi:hypothetical protein
MFKAPTTLEDIAQMTQQFDQALKDREQKHDRQ